MSVRQHATESTAVIQQERPLMLTILNLCLLRLPVTLILFFIGFVIIIGPKWYPEIIHITLVPGRGFTTQDAAALLPITLGLIWFFAGVWQERSALRKTIRQAPETAFFLALAIGLMTGLLVGIGIGIIFRWPIMEVVELIVDPLENFLFD